MADDHLDKEVSVSAELTERGVKASAKSRAVSAFDRLVGSVLDNWSAGVEGRTSAKRAASTARDAFIEEVGRLALEELGRDEEMARRAVQGHVSTILRRQSNKEAVAQAALEDLRENPPTDEQAASGPEHLGEPFLNRFQRYAEDAAEESLREKWGRVLAAEIRRPGTVSMRVMRVVDELDATTANLFEEVMGDRHDAVINVSLGRTLSVDEVGSLVSADLILDPGPLGHHRQFRRMKTDSGEELWVVGCGPAHLAIPISATWPAWDMSDNPTPIVGSADEPGLPVYILTDVGKAVARILPDMQQEALDRYRQKLATFVAPAPVYEYRRQTDGKFARIVVGES